MALLESHIAVITGAGSGIGRAIASGYAREGAGVVLLDVDDEAVAEAAREIRDAGGRTESFVLDVTQRDDCVATARKSPTTSGRPRSWSTMPASPAAMECWARARP
jgi:NAD(P)-dependent dehydrogenase (short-subunit alcohol dehydrogenase family)